MPKAQPAGAFSHVELISKDPAKSVKFYGKVFGWKFDDMGEGYMFFTPPALPTGALRGPQKGESPGSLSYIQVKDVDRTLRDAQEAGAVILVPKTEIPNFGQYAVFLAPGEVPQAIYQSWIVETGVYFFVKTTNPRPTFHLDMTPEERATMIRHVEYWTGLAKQGKAIAFGPVIEKTGPYGILVAKFDGEDELKAALANDPARTVFGYSWAAMGNLVSEKMVLG